MTIEDKVRLAANDCAHRLELIETKIAQEFAKPVAERQLNLLAFLYKEKEVFSFALSRLNLLLGDDQ